MLPFRRRLTLDQRRHEFARVQHYERVPLILERGSRETPAIDKEKFLVPRDLTVGQLTFVVRKRLKLDATRTIFLLVSNQLLTSTTTIASVYDRHRNEDGFLYVTYTFENAFG
jgi:GABA(A) receptor-associated protein